MSFAHPLALVVTLLVAIAAALLLRTLARRRRADALAYADVAFLLAATRPRIPWMRVIAGVWLAAIACMGIALAGPRVVVPVPVRDGAVALCIDTSGSMSAGDVEPTRAEAALRAARAFINALPDGTRIAIVSFSSSAQVVQPATDDKDVAREALARIPPPNGGTAIGDALGLAARSLPPVAHRAIVLVTDGVNNMGSDPTGVAPQLGAQGITIDTVGIGTHGSGELIPGTNEEADLDEAALRDVAQAAHGEYARAANADALEARLSRLARSTTLERRRVDAAFPLALTGGGLMIVASLAAFGLLI